MSSLYHNLRLLLSLCFRYEGWNQRFYPLFVGFVVNVDRHFGVGSQRLLVDLNDLLFDLGNERLHDPDLLR